MALKLTATKKLLETEPSLLEEVFGDRQLAMIITAERQVLYHDVLPLVGLRFCRSLRVPGLKHMEIPYEIFCHLYLSDDCTPVASFWETVPSDASPVFSRSKGEPLFQEAQ